MRKHTTNNRDEYFSSVEKSVDLGTFFPHNSTVDLGALGQKYPKKYPKVADLRVAGSKPKKIPEKMCTLPEIGNFTRKWAILLSRKVSIWVDQIFENYLSLVLFGIRDYFIITNNRGHIIPWRLK